MDINIIFKRFLSEGGYYNKLKNNTNISLVLLFTGEIHEVKSNKQILDIMDNINYKIIAKITDDIIENERRFIILECYGLKFYSIVDKKRLFTKSNFIVSEGHFLADPLIWDNTYFSEDINIKNNLYINSINILNSELNELSNEFELVQVNDTSEGNPYKDFTFLIKTSLIL